MARPTAAIKQSEITRAIRAATAAGLPIAEVRLTAAGDIRILTGPADAPEPDGQKPLLTL